MKTTKPWRAFPRAVLLGAIAVLVAGQVQAGDVVWSVGVGGQGVQVGATNAPPVWYPPRVIAVPQPVYLPSPPMVTRAPVYVIPQAYVVASPPPYYVQQVWQPMPHPGHGWGRYHRHHGYRDHDGWRGGRDRDHDRR
jgi:hypothetical protein